MSSAAPNPKILSMVLAGGEGKRLYPLTRDRAKPAVPFGGRYRLIDFVLSNLVNSNLLQVKVLTQYKSQSLSSHISRGWRLSAILDNYVEPVPAQMRVGRDWFRGSADAVYQNLNMITDETPDHVAIFGADHVYRMDVRQMLDLHIQKRADCTVAAIPVPLDEARDFGVIEMDHTGQMVGFEEKPKEPKPMPGNPSKALGSMGIYIFTAAALLREILRDAKEDSEHDFGRNIINQIWREFPTYVYDFSQNEVPGMNEAERGYWRDVGTTHSYYEANMDLIAVSPIFNLYNARWPIRTVFNFAPPAKFVFNYGDQGRVGEATDSLISEGCIVSGGRVQRSILSPHVRVNSYAHVEDAILFDGVQVGRYARVRRAIVDKNVSIPQGMEIGFDAARDRERFHITEEGLVVIPKNTSFG
jgi:glucose-1-phosphate adenylyltransferase